MECGYNHLRKSAGLGSLHLEIFCAELYKWNCPLSILRTVHYQFWGCHYVI